MSAMTGPRCGRRPGCGAAPWRAARIARPWGAVAGVAIEESPVDLLRQPHQRVAQVDDLVQCRLQQVLLAIVAWSTHRVLPMLLTGTRTKRHGNPNRKKRPGQ